MDVTQLFQQIDVLNEKLLFYQNFIDKMPVIAFINEIQKPNDYSTCRNVWTNKFGLDFIGYTQDEITAKGVNYFNEIIHPDDLEIFPISVKIIPELDEKRKAFVAMQRIKPRYSLKYYWIYGLSINFSFFPDGSPRQLLSINFVISEELHSGHQFISLLKEVNRLEYALQLSLLSKREKEILHLITKGKTDKEIAKQLFISPKTSKKHRTNILKKLKVHNSAELAAFAVECGEC